MNHFRFFLSISLAFATTVQAQPTDSLLCSALGHLDYTPEASDVWGYAADGKEYALIGLRNALSIVDVTDPVNPIEKERIPGAPSIWRDIKTWQHYAYATHDLVSNPNIPASGLLLVDMDSVGLPGTVRHKYIRPGIPLPGGGFDTLNTAHNLYIDENGICYIFGANVGNGGALMFDLNPDPWNPVYLGIFDQYYLHDGVVRGDTLWGSAVFSGFLTVVDVSNKAQPQVWATQLTPNQFTHNAWISDDNRYVFTTDEVSSAFLGAYDVTDLQNITEVDRVKTSTDPATIPHNVHYFDRYLVTSYYTAGVQIVDASEPDMLVEVGRYDTSPLFSGSGFNGAWGAYPWLPSGHILVSDIETGLWIVDAEYRRASFLRGRVVDSINGQPLPFAQIEELGGLFTSTAGADGRFKYAQLDSVDLVLALSAPGYISDTAQVRIVNGVVRLRDFALLPEGFGLGESPSAALRLRVSGHQVHLDGAADERADWVLSDLSGRIVARQRGSEEPFFLPVSCQGAFVCTVQTASGRALRQLVWVGR